MYCPKCGKQNVDDARFCAGCGAVLNEVQSQPVTQPVPAQPMVQPPQPMVKKKKTGFKVFLAILVVLLLVGVGVVSFMFISRASHNRKVKDQLALAEQYLDELQYEEAIAAYMAVLDLEPASEDAADGLTDTYIKWAESCAADGDYDKALEILQNADDRVSSRKIKKETSEIEAQQEAYQEQLRIEQEQREEEERQRLAEEMREKAGEILQEYMENTIIPAYGLLDCSLEYSVTYEKSAEYDWSAWPETVIVGAIVLTYDIRDYDGDNQAEMLVVMGKDSLQGERHEAALWIQMYETEGGTVYLSAEQETGILASGSADSADVNVYLMPNGTYWNIAIDSQEYYGLVADGVSYAASLWRYDGGSLVQEIDFRASGSDFDEGAFDDLAVQFTEHGLPASAEQARGNDGWGFPAYDEEGDGLERLFKLRARNPYLYNYDEELLSLWWYNQDPEGLGYVVYGFSDKNGGMAEQVEIIYGPQ